MTPPATDARRWRVYAADSAILDIVDAPGTLTSTAPLAVGTPRARHPFLTAIALDGSHEHRLREILGASSSTDDFIAKLRAQGFRVVAE